MPDSIISTFSFWWIFPIIMMILCFFMMKRRRSSMAFGFGPCNIYRYQQGSSNTAMDILDKRYATGEINREEYLQMKSTLSEGGDTNE